MKISAAPLHTSVRPKKVQWTTTIEPIMQWPNETMRMHDYLRQPYEEFLRFQLKMLRNMALILGIMLAPVSVILGFLAGHGRLDIAAAVEAWCGFLCFSLCFAII